MAPPMHRRWIDNRCVGRMITDEFFARVDEFVEFAMQQEIFKREKKLRCPCLKCKCQRFKTPDEVKMDLYKSGFMPNYYYWHFHGEEHPQVAPIDENIRMASNPYEQMVMDAAGPSFERFDMPKDPNPNSAKFYDMLRASQSPLWDGCENHTVLSLATRLLSIKSDYNIPEACMNEIITLMCEILPANHRMPANLYQTKKLVSQLGCGYQKIDCCSNGCMLYYGDTINDRECRFCRDARFKEARVGKGRFKEISRKQMWYLPIIPRLQRLFASNASAKYMCWHHENHREEGVLSHPSDGKTWKHFDQTYAEFASEPRNVRLGLCADGFTPFNLGSRPYSCWPVILTPYNLPPGMCMRREYMFLTIIIPGPSNPKSRIDVFLQPLVDDLKLLWEKGVMTYDISSKQNFNLRVALLWTVNDFPAYAMLSGWQTSGRLACPICMDRSKAFYLQHWGKICWFDCHRQFLPLNHQFRRNKQNFKKNRIEDSPQPSRYSGEELYEQIRGFPRIIESPNLHLKGYGENHNWTKRSIFWDLPYWRDLLNPHNIDVMHTEGNVFHNVFNTVMNVKGKTKDDDNARLDIAKYCKRPSLHLEKSHNGKRTIPKATYTFTMEQKRAMCEWVKTLKLPDGYASNLGRCIDMKTCTLVGMKSHDCHVFMERLLPIVCTCLPTPISNALTELSHFFRDLCAPTLQVSSLEVMEQNIPIILCQLERIFPPSFFDVMEHLPVHLVYEAIVGGPVQYRWMYPFERFLYTLKRKVKNKAHVEGSICEAYILEETSTFCSYYFETHVQSRTRRVPRNDDGGGYDAYPPISIFNYPGQPCGRTSQKTSYLTENEHSAITLYVLLNCPEVKPFLKHFEELLPNLSNEEVEKRLSSEFPKWFKNYVLNPQNGITDELLISLAWGPLRDVQRFDQWSVNGYKFHTDDWAKGRKTNNSGVSVKGIGHGQVESSYYGVLKDIIRLKFISSPLKRLTVFNCKWYDQTNRGTRICPKYGIVEVNEKRTYKGNDPFIFAQQAEQVYFTPYPKSIPSKKDWLVVIRTKARNRIDAPNDDVDDNEDAPMQDEANPQPQLIDALDDDLGEHYLRDSTVPSEEVDDAHIRSFIDDIVHQSTESSDEQLDEELLHTESSETEEDSPSDYNLESD